MLVEVIDALVLEQTLDEIQIGLAILDAVGPLSIACGETLFEIAEAMLSEDRLHDVGHVLLLEDPTVGGARQEPQPGRQIGAIARKGPLEADL